jgi:hypothetical protein
VWSIIFAIKLLLRIMGLLDNYSGIGMCPRPKWQHQGVIAQFFKCALPEIYMQDLILLSEATVTDDWDDLAPDLVVFSPDMEPLCIIEITTYAQCNAIICKCYELIERFPEAEYFVYDYERQILYQYDGENDEWLSSSEYILVSKYLNKAMMEYLQN